MSRPRMDRDDHRPAIGLAHHMAASADSHDREPCPLKRPDHLRPRNCRESVRHQATSRVSVSSLGGPTSASSASSAPRRSATAASADSPSPTAPTPGRTWAEAHQTPSSSCSTTYGTWTMRVTTSILPHPDVRSPRRRHHLARGQLAAAMRHQLDRTQRAARPHHRIPRPDRTHPRTRTALMLRLRHSKLCSARDSTSRRWLAGISGASPARCSDAHYRGFTARSHPDELPGIRLRVVLHVLEHIRRPGA